MKPNALLADLILYFHFLYVLGVLVPIPLIVIGSWYDWKWVRLLWLRRVHACMMLLVVLEAFIGMICPLTEWETAIRAKGPGGNIYPKGFIAALVAKLLFSDFELWVYTLLYIVTALIIIDLYILIPPKEK
jgi:hypothetical protein